jgi:hypothetical protein
MAITLDTSKDTAESSNDPVTNTYTCGANCRLLAFLIATDVNTTRTGGTPTYNSADMTPAPDAQQVDYGEGTAEIWYMQNPPTGTSYNCSVPNSGIDPVTLMIASFDATVGKWIFYDKSGNDQQTNANPTISITPTNANSLILNSMFSGDGTTPSGNSDSLLYQHDTGQEGNGSQYKLNAPASSNTLTWTIPSDDWNMVAAVFYEGNPPDWNINTNDGVGTEDVNTSEHAPEFQMSDSTYISASGENTTYQLTAPLTKSTTDFDAGRIQDDENPADTVDITVDDYTEMEWCFKGTDLSKEIQYDFRVVESDGTVLSPYSVTPQLTLSFAAGAFTVNVSDNGYTTESIDPDLTIGINVAECSDTEDGLI